MYKRVQERPPVRLLIYRKGVASVRTIFLLALLVLLGACSQTSPGQYIAAEQRADVLIDWAQNTPGADQVYHIRRAEKHISGNPYGEWMEYSARERAESSRGQPSYRYRDYGYYEPRPYPPYRDWRYRRDPYYDRHYRRPYPYDWRR